VEDYALSRERYVLLALDIREVDAKCVVQKGKEELTPLVVVQIPRTRVARIR
jgi:hypothetical protein